jgi:hypothetical protein
MNDISTYSEPRAYRDAPPRNESARRLARGLGWFSIGLGLAELVRPRRVANAAGMRINDRLVRGYGARELVTGVGLLSTDKPEPYVWARVVGDVLDLATVGAAASARRGSAPRAGSALLLLLGVTAIDLVCVAGLRREVRQLQARPPASYASRTGFPRGVQQMRGAAASAGDRLLSPSAARAAPAMADASELGRS